MDNDFVKLGEQFGFGQIPTLSEGVKFLTVPAFSIATVSVVIYFIMGAIKYLTSGGDKNAVSSAQNMITHAIIGFILLMMMFLVLQFLPQFLGFNWSIF